MRKFKRFVAIILVIAGVTLIVYPIAMKYAVQYLVKKNLQEVNADDNTKVTYNFEDVTSITAKDIVYAMNEELPVVGTISVPSVQLELPIIKGVSNSSMSAGAGTLKPDQKMGEGNYALASHHMKNPKLLFSPLDRVEIGAEIYLKDGKKEYVYQVIDKRVINADDIEVIEDDKDGRTLVTLITCNEKGQKRLLVVGELKESK